MPTVRVAAPIAAVPGLIRQAVAAVPHASLIDVDDAYALVGVRTNLAFRAETTRFDFADNGDGTASVHARSTNLIVLPSIGPPADDVLSTGRAVLDELVRLAAERYGR
ncbi:hypothetical protein [Frondihabitans australicus]|uniref:Uncharacterized protein n=1 Tax=Frondihabitans australicus TaxID=386892 RepID=A0A495IDX2_9MICO|nr:hypothetical protein [Frondihabitans australicus]RKR74203.1 hypothetical protein C8E83_1311 [Frondihabitans australicus]